MVAPLRSFNYPVRSADVWGLNEDERRDPEDIAADLDFQDNAIEDYLNTGIPNIYIQQSSEGSGVIDPAQLAGGTPAAGAAPVGNPPVWTDIATQAELTTHEADTTAVHGIADTSTLVTFGAQGVQRGTVGWTMGASDTNTSTTVIFSSVFSVAPIVALTVSKPGASHNLAVQLTDVTSAQLVARVFASAGVALGASSGSVHWVAFKA